jgi:hypothetical protein
MTAVDTLPPRSEFIQKMRLFLRDFKENNALIRGIETGPSTIDYCIDLAVSSFNTMPPHIGSVTYDSFPSLQLLHLATLINVLESAGLLQSRNQLTYSDGGITVQTSDKTQLYQSWIDRFMKRFDNLLVRFKRAQNAERCYGELASEYLSVSSYNYFGGSFGGGAIDEAVSLTLIF